MLYIVFKMIYLCILMKEINNVNYHKLPYITNIIKEY